MLLTKIILKDFGVYGGFNEFDFTCDEGKPIILIGGTNGSGKTTLFDSVMLCLYGMSAFGKKITRSSYEKYLKNKIHRYLGAPISADHASIVVQFKFFHNNEISEYQVNRIWRNEDGKIKEELDIKKRSKEEQFQSLDNIEKSYWQSFIEDLIPKGIAKLFFFDGEKIVSMAEEGNEDIAIKTSFNSLLGLDLVEQLKADLQINLVRNLGMNEAAKVEFERYQSEKIESESDLKVLQESKLQKEQQRDRIFKEIEEIEIKLQKMGGEFSMKREELKSKKILNQVRLDNFAQKIAELCSQVLPLSLIPNHLDELKKQIQNDEHSIKSNFEKEILQSNLKNIKTELDSDNFWHEISADKKIHNQLLQKISALFEQHIESKSKVYQSNFHFSIKEYQKILEIIEESKGQTLKSLETLTQQYNEIREELDKIETALINAPRDDEIGPQISKLNGLNKELGTFEAEIAHIDQKISSSNSLIKHIGVKMRDAISKQYKNKKSQEKAELTEKILDVLSEYSEKLKLQKISLLEEYLLDGILTLLHKENFVSKVKIDKETFVITLFREDGIEIPKDMLSKGEQQMFATAVLWALAKTSGRPLPFLIDTPLARLDKQHRMNLVEGFYPIASHQTVIFSTDMEIDAKYYSTLYPYITRSYSMQYQSSNGKTKQYQNYFWNEKGESLIEIH